MEAQEQTFRAQKEALNNIQQMLAQLLADRNTNDTGSNHNDEEHNDDERPKTEKSKESFSINVEVIKGILAQIASLTHRDELKKVEMTRSYLLEWDSVPYPPKFKPPTLHTYDGKSSRNQHIYYFRSQTGNVIDNDAIMVRLFIGTLKEVAFDWFKSRPSGSINSWTDLETRFIFWFYKDDTEVTMDKLLSTVQKGGESVRKYIERFCNLSLMCPTGMPLPMLLQTCRHNFLDRVKVRMGAVKAYTWKELVKQAKIAEKLAKKFEPSVPKNKWGVSTKGRDATQSSQ